VQVWIDLTNSPHVLVLRPVIEELQRRGHHVEVTARDFAQTLELCERFGIVHTAVGHHRGGGLLAKARGLAARSLVLARWARGRRFDLAVGHGSNDITVAAALLRIPSTTTFVPDAIPPERLYRYGARAKLLTYPGLKEEYYLSDFEPSDAVLTELGLDTGEPIAVVRTPPEVSLYHRFENDLFAQVLDRLAAPAQVIVLPRTPEQREKLARRGDLIIPTHAIDTQSLIAYANLVVSAGGTMNREAAALGVPVYTIFEGRPGAVDDQLIAQGRLKRLSRAEDIVIEPRRGTSAQRARRDPALLTDLLCAPITAG
jgi:hypothetical protein